MLSYDGPSDSGGWTLRADGGTLQTYSTDDLRSSIVYRARCFESADEAKRFDGRGGPVPMSLEHVLTVLAEELVARGKVRSVEDALAMPRRAFAMKLLDTLVRYPMPPREAALLPYNYCALPRLLPPWAKPAAGALLRWVC